jgi:hypothetical protein
MSVIYTRSEWVTRDRVRKRVRAVLAERDVSASEIARRVGWRQQYLARRLTPRNPVPFSIADIETIAFALGLDPTALTTDREVAA